MCKNTELPRPHMAGGKDRQADNRNQGPVASEGSLGSTRGLGAVGKGHLIGAGARSKLGRSEGSQRPSRQVSGNADCMHPEHSYDSVVFASLSSAASPLGGPTPIKVSMISGFPHSSTGSKIPEHQNLPGGL